MWGFLVKRKGSNASNSQKQKANRTNRLPMFPESKIKKRITRRCYGELTSKLGLSGSSLKDREKLLKVLLKCDSSQLPPSICHCTPGDHGYGCENSEEWALRLLNDNQSSVNSFSESNFSENVDYEKISEEYKACKVFALNKVHSVVRYQEHDRFIKDFMRDISRTFSSYNLFKYTNILAKFLNVVLAIHQKYPEMDYVQGLNFIIASLSLHCNEAMAFWLFCGLSEKLELEHYYSHIDEILQMANDSILELRLKNRKVPMDSFAATWAISLMSHSVPLEYSEMLWEHLFKSGWDGFKIIIDTILHVLKPELSQYCKFIKSSTKTTIICSNLAEMTIVLGRLNKPPRSREYALEFEIDENSCECFRLWEAVKIRLLEK